MFQTFENNLIIQEVGSKSFSNYVWATVILFGSIGFLNVSLNNLLGVENSSALFFPQSLLLCFYGFIGLFFSLYLWLIIYWDVGQGYSEFDKNCGVLKLYRKNFPGKDRRIQMTCLLTEIQSVNISFNTQTNLESSITLQLQNQNQISVTPQSFEKLEHQASTLASFLNLPIKEL